MPVATLSPTDNLTTPAAGAPSSCNVDAQRPTLENDQEGNVEPLKEAHEQFLASLPSSERERFQRCQFAKQLLTELGPKCFIGSRYVNYLFRALLLRKAGNPGCGKTILTASIGEQLENRGAVVYRYFFRWDNPANNVSIHAYQSLLTQMLYSNIFNQCLLDTISMHMNNPVKFLLFSRPNTSNLPKRIEEPRQYTINRENVDYVRLYLSCHLPDMRHNKLLTPDADLESLFNHLVTGDDGMFLWARLMMDYLEEATSLTPARRVKIIGEVTFPEHLERMYEQIRDELSRRYKDDIKFAWFIIT